MAGPSHADVLQEAVRAGIARVHTSMPGVIVEYDETAQKVVVQPVLRGRYKDAAGVLQDEKLPPIPSVPVAWPAGNGYSITWPLVPGDYVTLLFAERSTDEFRATGEDDIAPADLRRHSLSDAVAYPGGLPFSHPLPATGYDSGSMVVAGTEIRLGSSLAVDWLLKGTLFETNLGTFLAALVTFNAALAGAVDPVVVAAAAAFAGPLAAFQGQVAGGVHQSTKVRTE